MEILRKIGDVLTGRDEQDYTSCNKKIRLPTPPKIKYVRRNGIRDAGLQGLEIEVFKLYRYKVNNRVLDLQKRVAETLVKSYNTFLPREEWNLEDKDYRAQSYVIALMSTLRGGVSIETGSLGEKLELLVHDKSILIAKGIDILRNQNYLLKYEDYEILSPELNDKIKTWEDLV
jgi:hypothetical protein